MKRYQTVLAGLVCSVAACAVAAPAENFAAIDENDPRRGEKVDRLCFTSGINGFSQNSKYSVVLSKGTKDYLVTTRNRCTDLRHAMTLAVDSHSSCLTRGDRLLAFDSAFGPDGHSIELPCFVDEIYEWDSKAETAAEETAPDSSEEVESEEA